MIELAPDHKVGLSLLHPLMPAAGCFGYSVEYAGLTDITQLGAVVTNPVTLRPRRGAPQPRLVETDDGIILNTDDQNRGVRQVIQRHAAAWRRLAVPILVHLAPDEPAHVMRTTQALASTGVVAGFELGLPEAVSAAHATELINAARSGELPVLVRLPLYQATALAVACVKAGADALVVAAPPVAAAVQPGGRVVTGRLYGHVVHALVLPVLQQVRAVVSVPLVGSGGVHGAADAHAFLQAGAVAVQVDGALWRAPHQLALLIDSLA
jgi:dihydroorotate dehydrogenase (NAD+) catalytic subunit